jgi:hypothetical protein
MDIVSDQSRRQTQAINELYSIPEWVANADIVTEKEAAAELHEDLFADPDHRHFPLTSAADTWLSAAFFQHNRGQYKAAMAGYIEGNIKAAADIHGIADEVAAVFTGTARQEVKEASSHDEDLDNYGLVAYDALGNVTELGFPMFDAHGVKQAANHLIKHREKFPFKLAQVIASHIVHKAAEHEVEVPDQIQKLGGHGVVDTTSLLGHLEHRITICPDDNIKLALAKAAVAIGEDQRVDQVAPEDAQKLAEALERYDGLMGYTPRNHQFPEDIVWGLTIKQAQALTEDALPLTNHVFSLKKLAALTPDTYAVLGDDLVTELTTEDGGTDGEKLAAILPTLPAPDKALLESHLIALFN